MNKKSNVKGIPILLTAAFVWGIAFAAQTAGAEHLSAFSYTAIRYAIGVIPLLPIAYILEIRNRNTEKIKNSLKYGFLGGSIMFVAITLQQYGIQIIDQAAKSAGQASDASGKAGFITCLYILIVPLLGLIFKRFPSINVWAGVGLAVFGMYLLTIKESSSIETGDILVFLSAILWAVHILVVDKFVSKIHAVTFSATQFIVVSLISTICMLIFDHVTLGAVKNALIPLLYGGLGSVAIGYTLQIVGQKFASPVPASLALSMESVFAALAGAIFLKENLGLRGYIGCLLIFIAIVLAQLPEEWFKLKQKY